MTLFFVLSGFVIFLNYSQSTSSPVGLWNFFAARFARLYPLYFLCVTFDLLMKFAYDQFPSGRIGALPFYVALVQTWIYYPIENDSLVYQFGLMPQVSWSISTEWFFYFAFPFICAVLLLLKSNRQKLSGAIVYCFASLALVVSLVFAVNVIQDFGVWLSGPTAATQQDGFFRWLLYFSPYVRVLEFGLGCLCASLFISLKAPTEREQRFGLWLTIAAIFGIGCLHYIMFGLHSGHWLLQVVRALHMNFGFAPLMAVLIFCCARYQNGIARFVSSKWIVLGGEASYSIYLLHLLVINAFRYEAATITSWTVAIGSLLQLTITLGAIVGLSLVSYALIENPCRRWLRDLLTIDLSRNAKPADLVSEPAE
jgi:peptidoglycan/LPS O-acetylase OafA/YrhL